jgi:hypothetical protein
MEADPVFKITLDPALSASAVSGRLILLAHPHQEPLKVGGLEAYTEVRPAATEVTSLAPGASLDVHADATLGYPTPFSKLPAGSWHFQALLDVDHSYAYSGPGEDDLISGDTLAEAFDPSASPTVELRLTSRLPASFKIEETGRVRLFTHESRRLSDFWHRPISMRAVIVLPKDRAKDERFPVAYIIHGWGGDSVRSFRRAQGLAEAMDRGLVPRMILALPDASFFSGHHVFADSENNGPWGRALITELIPALEKALPTVGGPEGRFLTGHSSGGWSALWLMITYPDMFGGAWCGAPDPVDFRSFLGVDLTKNPPENLYHDSAGKPRNLVRLRGRDLATFENFVRAEEVAGPVGGQFASFEWVFSPRGADGKPRKLFDRDSGAVDAEVAGAWEEYDIHKRLARNWDTLAPKLTGKIHLIVGEDDTFHLEAATKLLFAFFQERDREKPFDVRMELHMDRDHESLYEGGLLDRMLWEMARSWRLAQTTEPSR